MLTSAPLVVAARASTARSEGLGGKEKISTFFIETKPLAHHRVANLPHLLTNAFQVPVHRRPRRQRARPVVARQRAARVARPVDSRHGGHLHGSTTGDEGSRQIIIVGGRVAEAGQDDDGGAAGGRGGGWRCRARGRRAHSARCGGVHGGREAQRMEECHEPRKRGKGGPSAPQSAREKREEWVERREWHVSRPQSSPYPAAPHSDPPIQQPLSFNGETNKERKSPSDHIKVKK